MSPQLADEVIALAGVLQASALVRQLAREGTVDDAAFASSLDSVTRIDAPSASAVFGGIGGVAHGLEALVHQLDAPARERDPEITRYAASLMHLEQRLMRSTARVEQLREAIRALPPRDTEPEDEWIARLAALYVETVGAIAPRIEVRGDERHLTAPGAPERVRALLLAGVRAAVLWRQLGGGRLRLLLRRSAYARIAAELLQAT